MPETTSVPMATRYERSHEVEAAPMQGETMLYHAGSRRFCLLNATATFVWEQLAEANTVDQLAAAIRQRFDGVDEAAAARDVAAALNELAAHEFVLARA